MSDFHVQWGKNPVRYEAGVDRGVLYPCNSRDGVPWDGIISVEENLNIESPESMYLDGVKVFEFSPPRDYEGVLKAYTYPDEFMQYDGYSSNDTGIYFGNQDRRRFGLSYRTLVNGGESYKIHILYNLSATPSGVVYNTLGSSVDPVAMTWKIHGIPVRPKGFRPTPHVIVDSRKMTPQGLAHIERLLYGDKTANVPGRLPSINDLVGMWSSGKL